MKNKIQYIIYLILGICIVYSIIAIPTKYYLSNKYDIELNEKRIEYGLIPINKNWKLDSTILQKPSRGFDCFLINANDTVYIFLENKWYCQHWTNKNIDKTKPYLKNKKIFYTQSFWIWQNRLIFETNTYINPKTKIADYIKLETTSFLNDSSIYFPHFSHIKNGEDIYVDFEFNNSLYSKKREYKIDSILKQWKIK